MNTQTKKRGRPPKVESEKSSIDVLKDINQLDRMVTQTKNSGETMLLVSQDIIKEVLKERYNNDPYMIYRNIELHDVERVDETLKKKGESVNQKIFGRSKTSIAAASTIQTGSNQA